MNAEVVLHSTKNLLAYKGKPIKVIPRLKPVKFNFNSNLNPVKGCGRVVKEV